MSDIQRRLAERRQARAGADADQQGTAFTRANLINFFEPVMHMISKLRRAGARFEAAQLPSYTSMLTTVTASPAIPTVYISVDTRRSVVITISRTDDRLQYYAHVLETCVKTNPIYTNDVDELEEWMLDRIVEFEYRPNRITRPPAREQGPPPASPAEPYDPAPEPQGLRPCRHPRPRPAPPKEDDETREQRVIDLNE